MTGHSLIRPSTVGQIIGKAIRARGETPKTVARRGGMKPKRLRAILRGKSPKLDDVSQLAIGLERFFPALLEQLVAAESSLRKWDRRDRKIAEELGLHDYGF